MPRKAALGVAVAVSELRTESRTIPRARVSSISTQQTTARRSQPPARAVVTARRPNSPASLIGAWSRCVERRLRFFFWNLPSSLFSSAALLPFPASISAHLRSFLQHLGKARGLRNVQRHLLPFRPRAETSTPVDPVAEATRATRSRSVASLHASAEEGGAANQNG